jgi:hypothetical protein
MGLLLVARVLIWRGTYQGIRPLLRITRRQPCGRETERDRGSSPPPDTRPHSSRSAAECEKYAQPGLRTLCDSRAQLYGRHDYWGKTPRAVPLISLVLVSHAHMARKEAHVTV